MGAEEGASHVGQVRGVWSGRLGRNSQDTINARIIRTAYPPHFSLRSLYQCVNRQNDILPPPRSLPLGMRAAGIILGATWRGCPPW